MPWYKATWKAVKAFFIERWPTILLFAVVLVIGFVLVKMLVRVFTNLMKKTKLNSMASKFLTSVLKIFLYIIYLIALLSLLGIPTTSLVALVSVGALAVSLAVQDVISNFASGIEIVTTKPFAEGDFVEIDGIAGNVNRITIVNTRLITPDGRTVTIPNNKISASYVINYTTQPTRRVDLTVSVAYESDIEKVKRVIKNVIDADKKILKLPAPTVRLSAHEKSALAFTVRVWVENADYWDVNFNLHEKIPAAFAENDIIIPYERLDVCVVPSAAKAPQK